MLFAATWALCPSALLADDAVEPERAAPLLSAMHDRAAQTVVMVVDDEGEIPATLIEQPVFRYSDQPRRFEDATLWVWTHQSRPVAMQKVEAAVDIVTGEPQWQFCLTSLAAETRIRADWPGPHAFCSVTGLEFQTAPETPAPSSSANGRIRQVRTLARRFAATIIDKPPGGETREELRLLPRPLHIYTEPDSDLPAGAVIGFAANGTNPDALLVLDVHENGAGESQWRFAPARMTTGGLEFRFDDEQVWSVEWVRPRPGYNFDRWIHFKTPRTEVSAPTAEDSEDSRGALRAF